jgi:hypothetical protein
MVDERTGSKKTRARGRARAKSDAGGTPHNGEAETAGAQNAIPRARAKSRRAAAANSETGNYRDYKNAEYNPREISPQAAAKLKNSMRTFGDLALLVVNRRTGNKICGHQRGAALTALEAGAEIHWLREYTAELGYPKKRFESSERLGYLQTPAGVFAVREVDWPLEFEKAANVSANNPHIAGSFSDTLGEVLKAIENDAGADAMNQVGLGGLIDDVFGAPTHLETFATKDLPPMAWYLIGLPTDKADAIADHIAAIRNIQYVEVHNSNSEGRDG